MTRVIQVGGVEEPFNLPWLHAIEVGAFANVGVEVTFENFAGGTGALVTALEEDRLDLATLLTEGAVTAIANGSQIRIHSRFVDSPLRWGIHVAHHSEAEHVSDLEGQRFAISRFGSGSELMARVLAEQQGWTLTDEQFVVVGGLDGALEALPAGTADIFMWERFVTAPHVGAGQPFKRVGELLSPWPSFYTAAKPDLLPADHDLVSEIVAVVLRAARDLTADSAHTAEEIVKRYGMSHPDTLRWLEAAEWPRVDAIDEEVLASVMATMESLGRIEASIPVAELHA